MKIMVSYKLQQLKLNFLVSQNLLTLNYICMGADIRGPKDDWAWIKAHYN